MRSIIASWLLLTLHSSNALHVAPSVAISQRSCRIVCTAEAPQDSASRLKSKVRAPRQVRRPVARRSYPRQ